MPQSSMSRREFLFKAPAMAAALAAIMESPQAFSTVTHVEDINFEDKLKETMIAMHGQKKDKRTREQIKKSMQATIAMHKEVEKLYGLKTSSEKEQAIIDFNARYNSSLKLKGDDAISTLIGDVNEHFTPAGIGKYVRTFQEISPYISDTFEEAGEAYGDIASYTDLSLPEDIFGVDPKLKVNKLSAALDATSKISNALGVAFDLVPGSDHMINEETLNKVESTVRHKFTQDLLKLHALEVQQSPDSPKTLDSILNNKEFKENTPLKDTFDVIQMSTPDLLARLDVPDDVREILQKALNNAGRPPSTDETVDADYLKVIGTAVERLNKNAAARIAKQKEISAAKEEEKAKKIAEKAALIKQEQNQDATVYLAATLLGRTGNPKAANAINVSYQAYKQLDILSKATVESNGAAFMTAGYVGVALMISDQLMKSNTPSPEQQMMEQMQKMFEALQKSIADFREEANQQFDGLANGQTQILYSIDEAANSINKHGAINYRRLQDGINNLNNLLRTRDIKDHENITSDIKGKIDDYVRIFKRALGDGLNDSNKLDIQKSINGLDQTLTSPHISKLFKTAYTGVQIDKWDAGAISTALAPDSIISPDFNVGVIPSIVHGLTGDIITPIPNPIEWGETSDILLGAYYKFPQIARNVEKNQGAFLPSIKQTSQNIDRSISALLAEETIQTALDKYQNLAEQLASIANEVHNETLLDLITTSNGAKTLMTNDDYQNALDTIGDENLPQLYPTAFTKKAITNFGKIDKKWLDGRLDITLRDLKPFQVEKKVSGRFGSSVSKKKIDITRKALYKEPKIPNTLFMNGDYYKSNGGDNKSKYFTTPDGDKLRMKYSKRYLNIKQRFETHYDILGQAAQYGLITPQNKANFTFSHMSDRSVYKANKSLGKTIVYGKGERKTEYSILTGPGTSFKLKESFLAAPKNPKDPVISDDYNTRLTGISDPNRSVRLSAPSHSLVSEVRNFGTERRTIKSTQSLVKALHRELYHHQLRVKKAIAEDIKGLINNDDYTKGLGLRKNRYEAKRTKVQNIVLEMGAISSSLRYMSAIGLLAKGASLDAATDAAKGLNATFNEDASALPITKQDIAKLIEKVRQPATAPLDEDGLPMNLRDYANVRFNEEVTTRLKRYHKRHLNGLENATTLPANQNTALAIEGLKYAM